MSSTSLLDLIKDRIRAEGPMDLAEYMGLCLGHPEYGYYMTRDPLGRAGDFITAPEVSQMFGEMIGLWLADCWMKFGRPDPFILLECGPGRGTLMADILRVTKSLDGFHIAMKLHLMEISPVLKTAQKTALAGFEPVWIEKLDELPCDIPLFCIGNEFLDALPVHQLVFDGQWHENIVGFDHNDTLCLAKKPAELLLLKHLAGQFIHNPKAGIYEVSPVLNHFINQLTNILKKQDGIGLFIDYGHLKSGQGDTLQAIRQHQHVSIFDTPGLCDLTVHVDFERVGQLALMNELTVFGPVPQGRFLKNLGIQVRAGRLSDINPAQQDDIKSSLHRLIDQKQMGTLFKAIAFGHNKDQILDLAGFE